MARKQEKRSFLMTAWGIIILFIIIIILISIISGWLFYHGKSDNAFISKYAQIIPLPIAQVGEKIIYYSDFVKPYLAAKNFFAKQSQEEQTQPPDDAEIKKLVLEDRLIRDVLVKNIADRYGVRLSRAEIDEEVNKVIANQGSQEDFEKFLRDYYNISLDEYKKYFTEPNLYYELTDLAVSQDDRLNGEAKNKIQEALIKLRQGERFEDLVLKYSESEYTDKGGWIGDFFRGQLPQYLEEELYAMKVGEYTDVVTLEDSLQIIKLNKKDEENGILTISAIVVRIITLEDLLEKEVENTAIKIYLY